MRGLNEVPGAGGAEAGCCGEELHRGVTRRRRGLAIDASTSLPSPSCFLCLLRARRHHPWEAQGGLFCWRSWSACICRLGGSVPTAAGTYCFDTGTGEWTKAGNWRLPFWSRALHVPELGEGLLFGIKNKHPHRFCVMDISGSTKTGTPPVRRHTWVDIDPPPNWRSNSSRSVAYLGDGKFCIHRSFDIMEEDGYGSGYDPVDTVVLLTGVEVVRAGSELQMVKHKSRRLVDPNIYSVF